MKLSLDHINMTVTNLAESTKWYKNIFGFKVVEQGTYEDHPWSILRNDVTMLCLYEAPHKVMLESDDKIEAQFHHIGHFGIRIRDKEEWLNKISQYDLTINYGGVVKWPHSSSWYVVDPTGYEIEVSYWDNDQIQF